MIKIIGLIQVCVCVFVTEIYKVLTCQFLEAYKLGVALFVIKPDLVASGKKNEIFDHVNNNK